MCLRYSILIIDTILKIVCDLQNIPIDKFKDKETNTNINSNIPVLAASSAAVDLSRPDEL